MGLRYLGSAIVTLNISGLTVGLISGQWIGLIAATSAIIGPTSGRILGTGSGVINAGLSPVDILSGTVVSGTRAYIHAFGY